MTFLIAIKDGKIFGSGSGENVAFKPGYDSIETFDNEDAFASRLAELRGA